MFKVGHVYTHAKMLDVCMLVVMAGEAGGWGQTLRVRWFKKNGLDLDAMDTIIIKTGDEKGWVEC